MGDVNVLRSALKHIEAGEELAIVSIIKAEGSAPRGVGTSMAVLANGHIYGTIGGGPLENKIIELSREAIKNQKSQSVHLGLDSEGVEMICGGNIDIYIDVYNQRPNLLIVGGGHIGYALYELGILLEFNTIIFEDREEFLNEERFPQAKELVLGPFEKTLGEYKIDSNSYIVIATRGHLYDQISIEQVLRSDASYIGAMGSKKKIITTINKLKEKGFEDHELHRLYAPIGLDIGSEKPKEIAMSIMAEILAIKNDGAPRHMKLEN